MSKINVLIVFILSMSASACLGQEILFSDDFTAGMNDAWVNPDGGWVAENGHLTVTTSCGFQQCNPNIYAGGPDQANYLISFDFLVTEAYSGNGAALGFYFNMSNPSEPDEGTMSGYVIQFGWSSSGQPANANCQFFRYDNSAATPLAYNTGSQFWIEPNTVYHVVLGKVGSSLVLKKWADGEAEPNWLVSVDDTTYSSGYWMPTWWNNVGWIDNFVVTGYGVVPNENLTWGGVKALFR